MYWKWYEGLIILWDYFQLEKAEDERRLYLNNSFDEIACLHLAVIYHLSKGHFENAFNTHVQVDLDFFLLRLFSFYVSDDFNLKKEM